MIKRNSIKKLAALSLLLIVFGGCKSKKQGMPGGTAEMVMSYKVAPVYAGKTTIHYTFPATIQGQQNVEIFPKVEGFIQNTHIIIGRRETITKAAEATGTHASSISSAIKGKLKSAGKTNCGRSIAWRVAVQNEW